MNRKRTAPPPFGDLHGDYQDSLAEVLLAAGKMQVLLSTLLEVGVIPEATRERVTKVLADYRRAWDGEQ